MNIRLDSFFQGVAFFENKIALSLTTQQKKILMIVSIAFCCLAACYAIIRFRGHVENGSVEKDVEESFEIKEKKKEKELEKLAQLYEANTKIDWREAKSDYRKWRTLLYETTSATLKTMALANASLAMLNEGGVYHSISVAEIPLESEMMKTTYQAHNTVPHRWITKGHYPGIWCALFDPTNTYSFVFKIPPTIKLTFKSEYKLFDPNYEEHYKMWEVWKSFKENLAKPNPWATDKNDKGQSMMNRIKLFRVPDHQAFFKEKGFGAIIGYSDYVALVVVQEEAIDKVEFLY